MATPLEAIETSVQELLAPTLVAYEAILADCWELINESLELANQRKLPPRGNLLLVLLTRLQGDLRVVHWAARNGYAVQAMALAAAVQELAYQAVYVGESDEETRRWAAHDREDRTYPECGHYAVLRRVASLLHYPDQWVDPHYRLYQQLCLAKHGNPVLAAQYAAVEREDSIIEVLPSPHFSAKIAHFARYALLHSSRAVYDAVMFFGEHHLVGLQHQKVANLITQIPTRINELGQRDGLVGLMRPDGTVAEPGSDDLGIHRPEEKTKD